MNLELKIFLFALMIGLIAGTASTFLIILLGFYCCVYSYFHTNTIWTKIKRYLLRIKK